jgi:KUP system potassium uptake protein
VFSFFFFLVFGFIDGAYLSATLLKVPQGAWTTIVIAAVISMFMIIWHNGKLKQWEYEEPKALTLPDLIKADIVRTVDGQESVVLSLAKTGEQLEILKGLCVIFDSAGFGIPPVFSHFTDAFAASPDISVFLHIRNLPQPTVSTMANWCIETFFRLTKPFSGTCQRKSSSVPSGTAQHVPSRHPTWIQGCASRRRWKWTC